MQLDSSFLVGGEKKKGGGGGILNLINFQKYFAQYKWFRRPG